MPIQYAKLLLLGVLTWQEDEEYGSDESLKFVQERLWVGSANGTIARAPPGVRLLANGPEAVGECAAIPRRGAESLGALRP